MPQSAQFEVAWRLRGQTGYEKRYPARRDTVAYHIQKEVELHVFWKALPVGTGPAFSLFMYGVEFLGLECFGKDEGHYHVSYVLPGRVYEPRIFFAEPTRLQQVERSIHELTRNVGYYQERHPWRRIRTKLLDMDALSRAADEARERALVYLKTVPEIRVHEEPSPPQPR